LCPSECDWIDCSQICKSPDSDNPMPRCYTASIEEDCKAPCVWEADSDGSDCGCLGGTINEFDKCVGSYNEKWCEFDPPGPEDCEEKYICSGNSSAFQKANCDITAPEICDYGCNISTGECNAAPVVEPSPLPSPSASTVEAFVPKWTCVSEYWREWQTTPDQSEPGERCDNGCVNGECRCSPKSCVELNVKAGSCGVFDDGCGSTISCGCSGISECVNGSCECAPKRSCSTHAQCGTESDGCGGTVNCGTCDEGFECDEGWKTCVLGKLPDELEIMNIEVFASKDYAVVSWSSSVESSARVEFGLTGSLGSVELSGGSSTAHRVVLKGLLEQTKYYYKVSSSALDSTAESAVQSFVTGTDKDEFKISDIDVDPSSGIQMEGQSFSFAAITTALDQDSVEFEWDFGDGTGDSSGARVFHSFYGLGEEEEKSFTVKVKATDSEGNTSSAERTVKVLKAVFRAVVLKPEPFEKQSKELLLEVWIAFVDRENEVIECGKIEVKAEFNNSLVDLECTESEYFVGSMQPWYGLQALELLEINATYNDGKTKHLSSTRFPVYFESIDVATTSIFGDKEFYLFDELEDSTFWFWLEDLTVIVPIELKAELVSGDESEEVSVQRKDSDFLISFDHTVTEGDYLKGLELRLSGKDDRGNEIIEVQAVPLGDENPELTVALLSPQSFEFAFGQTVEFKARILSVNYALLDRRIFVESKAMELFEEMELNLNNGVYSIEVELPGKDSGLKSADFKFFGHGVAGEREIADLDLVGIDLSDSLNLEMVSPKAAPDKTGVLGTELNEIRLKVFQPNGLLFEDKELTAAVSVDGASENVVLKFNESSKEYSAALIEPIGLGEHSVSVSLYGDFKGSTQTTSVVEQDLFVFQMLGLLIGGMVLLGVLAVVSFGYRNIVSERRFLLSERSRLIGLRKSFKFEFYKRHINQLEFNSAITQVNEGVKGINSILKNKGSWLYVGLMKTIYRSGDYKSLPENLQVALLVNRLAGRRGEYSRGEIRRVMTEEGYTDTVIEKVVLKLYGERPAKKPFK